MAIITRLSRLFQADVNALLDRIEEPEIMVRQSIREMELHLDQSTREIRSLTLDVGRCQQEQLTLEQQLEDFDHQLDLCFDSDKPDLARALVRRKLETSQRLDQLKTQLHSLRERIASRESLLVEQQSRLDHLRQKAEILLPTEDSRSPRPEPAGISEEQVEVALLREQARRAER